MSSEVVIVSLLPVVGPSETRVAMPVAAFYYTFSLSAKDGSVDRAPAQRRGMLTNLVDWINQEPSYERSP
jgi:hypothetical protein